MVRRAMLPGVSFVVPIYNKSAFLPATLAAIAAQRGDFPREYVFVDDGSTDDSLAVLERATGNWPERIVIRQANGGSAKASNRGLAAAKREFVKFVDADDILLPEATQRLVDALAPSDAVLAYGGLKIVRKGTPIDAAASLPPARPPERMVRPLRAALKNSLFNPTQFLVRTRAALEAGGCDERVRHSQEYGLALRLAAAGDFLRLPYPIAYQIGDAAGLSAQPAKQLARITRAMANFLRDRPDTPRALVGYACRRAAGRAWIFARRHRRATVASPWFRRYLASRFIVPQDPPAFIEACALAFENGA